ncbi:uncharacterized protein LOC128953513 [Oppia nitens]|uniref:uncharacterized protein LOC128953513 n=1 Tax=Oppia nitens TaxID=1686743 RepID=UPI0023DB89F3|nr:uncharacterized protein LOC128953513 [Oppia nitens]
MTTEMSERANKFKNPVLFLGANESDYNTIAWNLMIENMGEKISSQPIVDPQSPQQKYLVGFERRCFLEVPEGGYIVGVEDWPDGIREIEYRHRYEQLHRAIVKHQMPERNRYTGPHSYELPPEVKWLNKIILNINTDIITIVDRLTGQPIHHPDRYERDIHIDIVDNTPQIRQAYSELIGQRFVESGHSIRPKEFNFSRFSGLPLDPLNPAFDTIIEMFKISPPAYPPVKIQTNQSGDQYRLFYLPQSIRFKRQLYDNTGAVTVGQDIIDLNLLTVFNKYHIHPITYKTVYNDTAIYPTPADDHNFKQFKLILNNCKFKFPEYDWWWRYPNPYLDKHRLTNVENIRLGVDGHFYEKSGSRSMLF